MTIIPLLPVPVLASFPGHTQDLPSAHLLDVLDEEAIFQPLLPLLAFDSGHVFNSLGVVERVDQSDDSTLVLLALLFPTSDNAFVRREVVVCADVGGLNAVDGSEVRSDVGLGYGLGDAKCGFVGVIRTSGWGEISDHSEDDVWKVNLPTDDLSLRRSVLLFDHFCTTYPRPPIVEFLEPCGFGEFLPVGSNEFALGESALVTSELGRG